MPENEFEKKLQQKMEELKLAPSDEVWNEVEYRIRKEKKKRRVFFWLPLFLLITGGGIATTILLTNNKNNNIVQSKTEAHKLQSNHSSDQQQPAGETSLAKGRTEKTTTEIKKQDGIIIKKYEQDNNRTVESFVHTKNAYQKNKRAVKNKRKELIRAEDSKTMSANVGDPSNQDKQNNKPSVTSNTNANQQLNQQNNTKVSTEIVAEKKSDELKTQIEKDSTVNTATEEKKTLHLNKKSKWQWSIMLEGGKSLVTDRFKLFNNKTFAGNMYASSSSQSSAGSPVYTPSDIRQSGSFGAGVFIERPISKRFGLNFGLNYLFLSTKMNVGSRVDSSRLINNSFSSLLTVDNFYRASNSTSSYTNRYHFLSSSVGLSWRIMQIKKFQLYWNNSLSYSFLFSSNALHFDTRLPGYYKDYRILTHNHLFLSTGFSLPVFKRFTVNPFAEYSLTPVLRHNSDSLRTHFTNYGIRINFLLKNKK